MGITMSLNVVYVIWDDEVVIAGLANVVAASMLFAQVFLLLFVLIIRYSQAQINKQKQVMWTAIAGLLGLGLFLVGWFGGAVFGTAPTTGDKVPVWEWYYSLYFFIVAGVFILLTMINAYLARKSFSDVTMRKRFTYFLIGMGFLFWLLGGNPWANLYAEWTFRTIFGYSALVILPAAFLLYSSLGKEVAK